MKRYRRNNSLSGIFASGLVWLFSGVVECGLPGNTIDEMLEKREKEEKERLLRQEKHIEEVMREHERKQREYKNEKYSPSC